MLKKEDFENLIRHFLLTYKQLLLQGNLHRRMASDVYHRNSYTWDTILRTLETGVLLGLANVLEDSYFGREFEDEELKGIAKKIIDIRNDFIAHINLSKMRDMSAFLKANQLTGTDIIKTIDALKMRAIQYQKAFNVNLDIQGLFKEATQNTMKDLDAWLKSFSGVL